MFAFMETFYHMLMLNWCRINLGLCTETVQEELVYECSLKVSK